MFNILETQPVTHELLTKEKHGEVRTYSLVQEIIVMCYLVTDNVPAYILYERKYYSMVCHINIFNS